METKCGMNFEYLEQVDLVVKILVEIKYKKTSTGSANVIQWIIQLVSRVFLICLAACQLSECWFLKGHEVLTLDHKIQH